MSAERFTSFLPHLRDRGRPLQDSWCSRYYPQEYSGAHHDYFELWSIKPFWELNAEDILWALVAAASDPFATHLRLYVFAGSTALCPSPKKIFQALVNSLESEFGFNPDENGYDFGDSMGGCSIFISLFSFEEAERVSAILAQM